MNTPSSQVETANDGEKNGEWRRLAACSGQDPELFFPLGESSARDIQRIRIAKKICSECPVVQQCLADALAGKGKYGIWGGMTEAERRRLARRSLRAV